MLEECEGCGTRFAPDLAVCPHCGLERAEGEMPKIVKGTGPTFPEAGDGTGPAEIGSGELPAPPPVSAPKAEHVSYAAEVLDVPVDEAEAMRKADLVQLARDAAADAQAPDAAPGPAPAPAAPPRVPPRRVLPPGAPGD